MPIIDTIEAASTSAIRERAKNAKLTAARRVFRESVLREATGQTFTEEQSIQLSDALELIQGLEGGSVAQDFEAEVSRLTNFQAELNSQQRILRQYGVADGSELLAKGKAAKNAEDAAREALADARRVRVETKHAIEHFNRSVADCELTKKRYPEFVRSLEGAGSAGADTSTRGRRGKR